MGNPVSQFARIALALLTMTGRVTMLGLSRWTGQGGSYRTIQRFFATVLPWASAALWPGAGAGLRLPAPPP